ncbi:MAG TPA: hypothetical protein VJZ04_06400 [Lachnospiraceae bacterium]|nr:hypothetical protein [Lachnospiraceae bacterium]
MNQINEDYIAPLGDSIPEEPKKKSQKPLMIVLISILAIGIIVALTFFIMNKWFRSTKDKVFDGMKATLNEEVHSPLDSYLGLKKLTKMIESGSFQEDFSLSLDRIGGNYMDNTIAMVEGVGIQSSSMMNVSEKKYSGNSSITYAGIPYLNCDIFAYDDFIALQIPELLDGYFEIKTSNLGKDFNNSYISEASGETLDESLVFNFFDLFSTLGSSKKESNIVDSFHASYKKDMKKAYDDITVEKVDSASLQVGKKEQSCQGYLVTIPTDSMQTMGEILCEYLNETMAKEALPTQDLSTILNYESLKPYLNKDFIFTVYLDKKGRMVMLTQNTEMYDGLVTIDSKFQWLGTEFLSDTFTGTIQVLIAGQTYTMNIDSNSNLQKDVNENNLILAISQGGTSLVQFTYHDSFNSKTGILNLSCLANQGATELLRLDVTGGFEDVTPGKGFTFNLDDVSLDINSGDYTASLSGDFTISPLNTSIASPTGTKYNLFEMNENDFTTVVNEITKNLNTSPLVNLITNMLYGGY